MKSCIFFFLLLCFLFVVADDRQVLIEFYNATNGEEWRNKTNWLTNSSICSWFGIRCSVVEDRVNCLLLPNNRLSGVLPSSLSNLTLLAVIDLSSNSLRFNSQFLLFEFCIYFFQGISSVCVASALLHR